MPWADLVMSELDPGSLLGCGKDAEVFPCGALVIKLYRSRVPKRSAFREAAILSAVEALGLPVPSVHGVRQVGDRWGVLMSRAEGPSYGEAVAQSTRVLSAHLEHMAALHTAIHRHSAPRFVSDKAGLAWDIGRAPMLDDSRRGALLARLTTMPDGDRLCHGDFHPDNIMGPLGHEIVIDWLNATRGAPAADVCRTYVLLRATAPHMASAYIDAYVQASGESRDTILEWLPLVAAARLAEGVPEVSELLKMLDERV